LILPDLLKYRNSISQKGIAYPLSTLPVNHNGLLSDLPKALPGQNGWPWTEQVDPAVYAHKADWPKLTIVTPSYNQGQYIEETLRAVILQNYPNLEFIVIDGGSTDNTVAVLKKYSKWISYYQSEKDNGQAHAINTGFSLASGSYMAWINSDDSYVKNAFHLVISCFLSTDTEFIYGYAYDYNVVKKTFTLNKVMPVADYFIKIPVLAQPSCFWSAKIHQPLWEDLHCALDYELWMRLLKGHKRQRIKQALSVAKTHEDAKTHDPKLKARWDADCYKIWSDEGHGPVPEWNRLVFLNRIRMKLYRMFNI
jgi:glycosyltransferase involved in cell wall biosynthesis